MKNNKLLKAVLSALTGHAVGLLFILLLSFVAIKLDTPISVGDGFAFISALIGSLVCGLISKKLSQGTLGGLLSGALFAGVLLAVSVCAPSPSRPIPVRIGVCLVFLFVVFIVSGISKGGRRIGRKSAASRRRLIYKNT